MPTISAFLSQHHRTYSSLARQLEAVIIVVYTVQVVRLRTNQWPVSALCKIFAVFHPMANQAILNWRCLHLQNFAYAFVLTKMHVVLSVITPKIPTTCSSWIWSTGFVFQFNNCPTVARLPYLAIKYKTSWLVHHSRFPFHLGCSYPRATTTTCHDDFYVTCRTRNEKIPLLGLTIDAAT